MRLFIIVALLFPLIFLTACNGGRNHSFEKQFEIPKNGYPITVEDSGSEQVDALVRQLVSKRPAPFRSGYWDGPTAVVFADRYSTPEVKSALIRLKKLGPAIFPQLVKHVGDDRYSYSIIVDAWANCTVGEAVIEVMDDGYEMHSGYKWRDTASGSDGYLSFRDYLDARGLEHWAEWAKNKSRLEIQIDFIDWCIEKENQRGYTDDAQKKQILENYERARADVFRRYSKTEKRR